MENLKQTPLTYWHKEHGGKMVDYAGWCMPVQYEGKGLKEEHEFTRTKASLFDVSHMGEFRFKGPEALKALEYLSPSCISKLQKGESCYSFFANENGGVVDDLLIYCFEPGVEYLLCVNAANTNKMAVHLERYRIDFDVEVLDEGTRWGQIAIQGPEAVVITEQILPGVSDLKRFAFGEFPGLGQSSVWVARTGYTGEDGFEIFVELKQTQALWQALEQKGAQPCGLGARDTLRLEAALNLYGNELTDTCNPYECRMAWTIDLTKESFLGKAALEEFKLKATKRLVGLKVLGRAIPRSGYEVISGKEVVGVVTSGTLSPSLNVPIAMAWIEKKALGGDKTLEIQIRKRKFPIEIVGLPFLKNI